MFMIVYDGDHIKMMTTTNVQKYFDCIWYQVSENESESLQLIHGATALMFVSSRINVGRSVAS